MQLATLGCEMLLPSCDTSNSLQLPLPSPPCHSECEAVVGECTSYFNSLESTNSTALLVTLIEVWHLGFDKQCNSTGDFSWSAASGSCNQTTTTSLDYPFGNKVYASLSSGTTLSASCNSGKTTPITTMQLSNVHCQSPLLDSTDYANNLNGGACGVPCPSFEYTQTEWQTMDDILSVLNNMSTVCSLFLVVTWLLFPVKRAQSYNLLMFMSLFGMSLLFWIGSISTKEHISQLPCQTPTRFCSWEDSDGLCALCSLQAFFLVYGLLSSAAWWTVIALDLASKILFAKQFSAAADKWFQRSLTAFGALFPVVFALPPLADGQYTASNTSSQWCQINSNTMQSSFFWYPLLTCACIVTLVMVPVIYRIWRSSRSARIKQRWTRLIRPALFIFMFDHVVVFHVFLHFYGDVRQSALQSSALEFITCVLTLQPNCGDAPKDRFNVGLIYTSTILLSMLGVVVFIIYGFTHEVFQLWVGFCLRGTVASSLTISDTARTTSNEKSDTATSAVLASSSAASSAATTTASTPVAQHGSINHNTKSNNSTSGSRGRTEKGGRAGRTRTTPVIGSGGSGGRASTSTPQIQTSTSGLTLTLTARTLPNVNESTAAPTPASSNTNMNSTSASAAPLISSSAIVTATSSSSPSAASTTSSSSAAAAVALSASPRLSLVAGPMEMAVLSSPLNINTSSSITNSSSSGSNSSGSSSGSGSGSMTSTHPSGMTPLMTGTSSGRTSTTTMMANASVVVAVAASSSPRNSTPSVVGVTVITHHHI